MKVIVCGGRKYDDKRMVFDILSALPAKRIIQGGADGADALAREYAKVEGINCVTYRARWEALGKKAGPARNQEMIDKENPDMVVAFKGGRGTADMVNRAKKAGIKVFEVYNV